MRELLDYWQRLPQRDRLDGKNAGLNMNYQRKKVIKPLREGTDRYKLVIAARKGITIEEVMSMFGLLREQAVYKLRDLHYTAGHGLQTRGGKVFVVDDE